MSALTFLLGLGGFTALALAMPRHFQFVLGRSPARGVSLGLRILGWMLIAASLAPAIAWLGNPVGLVAWFGVLNAAALLTALALTMARRGAEKRR